jgi:hypothetical protein
VIRPGKPIATVAKSRLLSAGDADADSPYARTAWKKISGECPAMELHGSVLTAERKTDWGTSENSGRFSQLPACILFEVAQRGYLTPPLHIEISCVSIQNCIFTAADFLSAVNYLSRINLLLFNKSWCNEFIAGILF